MPERLERIQLVPLFLAAHSPLLPNLAAHLQHTFAAPVLVRSPRFDPELAFDSARGQYSSTVFLTHLLKEAPAVNQVILGIAGVDLFIPILTYVFGEAQLGGRVAVVSSYRLTNTLYGLPADDDRLTQRLLTEATHELGHTRGLVHCPLSTCVMHSSTYVEDIDLKSTEFCARCRSRLALSDS